MNLKMEMKLGSHGSLKTYRIVNGLRVDERERGVFKNIILNTGLAGNVCYPWVASLAPTYIAIGSGSTLPKYTNTKLNAALRTAYSTAQKPVWSNVTTAGRTSEYTRIATFEPTGTGYNVAELGLSGSSLTSGLQTHALIRDPVTSLPVTLAVKADEYLEVTYRYTKTFSYPASQQVTINGLTPTPTVTMESFEGNPSTSTATSNTAPRIYYATDAAPNTYVSGGSTASPENGLLIGEGGDITYTVGRVIAPTTSERVLKRIVMGYGTTTSYYQLRFTLATPVTWPANYELKVNFTINIVRDPEPTT